MRRALYLALLLGGCAQILDLEDRKVAESLDSGTPPGVDAGTDTSTPDLGDGALADAGKPPSCEEYCELSERLCTADAGVQHFTSKGACLEVCKRYSTDPKTTGNTLACRVSKLRDLAIIGASEAETTCPAASPGGGPPANEPNGVNCGTDCEGFCALRAATCPVMNGDIDCVNRCKFLVDDKLFNANDDFNGGDDTLACRIAHLSAAAYYGSMGGEKGDSDRKAHCSHSGIRSEVQCDFTKGDPDCDSYCKIVTGICAGDKAIYSDEQQCLKVCAQFGVGQKPGVNDVMGSRRCLRAGAYDALEGATAGCQRASIAGDGCIGGRCGSYCYFAKQACPDAYAAEYASDEACQTKCLGVQDAVQNGPFAYNAPAALGGASIQCRLRRLTQLLAGGDTPANACPAVLGLPGSLCF